MNNLFAAVLVFAVASGAAAAQPGPAIVPAIDGIMAAFKDHPLVGLGDAHGLAQEQDFYAALVRDPRFAREVGNVVVEFGNAAQQGVIDRFVNGEDVPYAELRKVWTDPVGWAPPPADLGYVNLFAQIRAVNRGLPASGRIRVWLGDPPLDWSKIRSKADITPFPNGGSYRDVFSAALIEREILAKGKKAVAIFGWFHFNTDPVLQPVLGGDPMMVARVEQSHPNAFYIVTPYAGRKDKACAAEFEADKKDWPAPSLAAPVRGTALDDADFRRRCPIGDLKIPPEVMPHMQRLLAGGYSDAMLWLGPTSSLTSSPSLPDAYLDDGYRKEILRHWSLYGMAGEESDLEVGKNPASPRPYAH